MFVIINSDEIFLTLSGDFRLVTHRFACQLLELNEMQIKTFKNPFRNR